MTELTGYYDPPKDGYYSVEYCILEFWSGSKNPDCFKCVVATTFSYEIAEKIVMEDELHRTWVKAYRLYQYPEKENKSD